VHAHAHADGPCRERLLSIRGGGDGIRSASEGYEERVTLRVYLDAPLPGDGVAYDVPVLREHVCVVGAELMEEARRALDVREEKGDSAGWQLLHVDMMTSFTCR
jgi:hypothetical protein